MLNLMALSHLNLRTLNDESQDHSDFEALYLAMEPS